MSKPTFEDYIRQLRDMGFPSRIIDAALESMWRELTRPSEPSSVLVGPDAYEMLKAMFGGERHECEIEVFLSFPGMPNGGGSFAVIDSDDWLCPNTWCFECPHFTAKRIDSSCIGDIAREAFEDD